MGVRGLDNPLAEAWAANGELQPCCFLASRAGTIAMAAAAAASDSIGGVVSDLLEYLVA